LDIKVLELAPKFPWLNAPERENWLLLLKLFDKPSIGVSWILLTYLLKLFYLRVWLSWLFKIIWEVFWEGKFDPILGPALTPRETGCVLLPYDCTGCLMT